MAFHRCRRALQNAHNLSVYDAVITSNISLVTFPTFIIIIAIIRGPSTSFEVLGTGERFLVACLLELVVLWSCNIPVALEILVLVYLQGLLKGLQLIPRTLGNAIKPLAEGK